MPPSRKRKRRPAAGSRVQSGNAGDGSGCGPSLTLPARMATLENDDETANISFYYARIFIAVAAAAAGPGTRKGLCGQKDVRMARDPGPGQASQPAAGGGVRPNELGPMWTGVLPGLIKAMEVDADAGIRSQIAMLLGGYGTRPRERSMPWPGVWRMTTPRCAIGGPIAGQAGRACVDSRHGPGPGDSRTRMPTPAAAAEALASSATRPS